MEFVFGIFKFFVFGFFILIILLFAFAAIFGKRVKKRWEFEAEFHDERGREFGEFDIEMSRIEKEEQDFTFKAKFRMRHASLVQGTGVEVYVDELLVVKDRVEHAGRIAIGNDKVVNALPDARVGQTCRVVIDGREAFSAALQFD